MSDPHNIGLKMMNEMIKERPHYTGANQDDAANGIDDLLVEMVWRDLDGQLPRDHVSRVVCQVAQGFQDATVTTFLPVLVHRRALEKLKEELVRMNPIDKH